MHIKAFGTLYIALRPSLPQVTTVGYGDKAPKSPLGRILAIAYTAGSPESKRRAFGTLLVSGPRAKRRPLRGFLGKSVESFLQR